jgi:hypothetical protein
MLTACYWAEEDVLPLVGIKRAGIGQDVRADMSRDPRLSRTFCRRHEEEVIGHKMKTREILTGMQRLYH